MTAPTDDLESDAALLTRWRGGDERAATEIVERHGGPLARFAASLGVHEDVEEIVQDTFVRAFASLESFRGESSLRTWLFTILRRLVLDRRRARARRPIAVPVEESDAITEFDALDGMVAGETERRVGEAMASLTPTQREVFTLRVAEGLSYKEIAEVAETTEGAARVHYHNAMRAVKELLDG
ncbi:MAG: RNA polymerase sigma factor [Gemmatimonadaceae bacterium]|nr:RNA polymerase sigma factor [Gemmatimonadaceae bacterium]NUQ92001.1 RNA polymerase sigma factor [Gemmatimonadaceae bacterium]NUR19155.1 RNA polymerase sigma factor [Gemmatimonadaceae bacterium]